MNLSNYTVKDFVLNESFQQWILEPDEEGNGFWESWLRANPDKIELIREAEALIQSLRRAYENELKNECDQVWDEIAASINALDNDAKLKRRKEIENTR